ncbi:MAG: hypothetical protein ACMG6E_06405 [Candidatus Roizmanbacteria bacterium]
MQYTPEGSYLIFKDASSDWKYPCKDSSNSLLERHCMNQGVPEYVQGQDKQN